MRVGISTVYSPGVRGGAELHADGLASALRSAGHQVHLLRMPFSYWPISEVDRSMNIWATQNFSTYDGGQIDQMICLKFPSYLSSHPNKKVWLLHQHRPAYDLYGTSAGFPNSDESEWMRDRIIAADQASLGSIKPLFTNSGRVSERLKHYNGISSHPLYHPPFGAELFHCAEPLPYIFYPSRLEHLKRQRLLIEAIAACAAPIGAILSGEGGTRGELERLIEELEVGDRVKLLGHISREEMVTLYAHASAVFFGPFDEDYGYVTLEAMLSSKPVITCTDSGGPLEFVVQEQTGLVADPTPESIAAAISTIFANPARARQMGAAGWEAYQKAGISWSHVVEALTTSGQRN